MTISEQIKRGVGTVTCLLCEHGSHGDISAASFCCCPCHGDNDALIAQLCSIQASVHNLRERVRDDDAADRMASGIEARLGEIIGELQREKEEL